MQANVTHNSFDLHAIIITTKNEWLFSLNNCSESTLSMFWFDDTGKM